MVVLLVSLQPKNGYFKKVHPFGNNAFHIDQKKLASIETKNRVPCSLSITRKEIKFEMAQRLMFKS